MAGLYHCRLFETDEETRVLIIDTQVHLWEAHRPDRPWPAEEVERKVFVAMEGARPHRAEPLQAEEFVPVMDSAGVQRAVIVPPSPVGDSNLTALEAVARYPQRFGIMGRYNPLAPDARAALARWREQPGMLGVRMTFHKPQWRRWLDQEDDTLAWFWRSCERLDIPVMLLAPGVLPQIERVAARHPGLTLIFDHMARHSGLRDDACFADLDELLALARYPNVAVKASAVPCYSTQPYPFANLRPYLQRIYEAFGPARMMWGSDFTRLPCSYQECVDHFLHTLDFLDDAGKEWVMGKAAAQLLRWPQTADTPA